MNNLELIELFLRVHGGRAEEYAKELGPVHSYKSSCQNANGARWEGIIALISTPTWEASKHFWTLLPHTLAWNRFCTRSCPNNHLHHCFYIHRSSCAKHYSSTTSTTRLSTTERLVHQSHLNPITYLHTLPRNVNCGSVNCTGKAI